MSIGKHTNSEIWVEESYSHGHGGLQMENWQWDWTGLGPELIVTVTSRAERDTQRVRSAAAADHHLLHTQR